MAISDPLLREGDRAIRRRILALAADRGLSRATVLLTRAERASGPEFTYRLEGTEKSVSFRERELRSIAERDHLTKFVELRLEAMFEEIWWRQALVLMRGS